MTLSPSTTRPDPWHRAAQLIALLTLVGMVLFVVSPWLRDTTSYGFHDWDVITSFRYLTKVSLLEHGELPWWNPYACGGYPSWGYAEGGTNLVSPWIWAYLYWPLPLAIRVEVIGMALLGAVGAYALGGRFTRSHGARLLIVALWAVNGRWALQAAAGHAWHLSYAYLPWCFFFYERARSDTRRFSDSVMLALCLAAMVYAGGIYPLPHTVLALGLYALLLAWGERSLRPIATLALAGVAALGLAAPKLWPMLEAFGADPRLIDSRERLDLGAFFTLLTSRDQSFSARPARVAPYGWHEWGMYISVAGVAILAWGVSASRDARQRALQLTGLGFVALGFGAFHEVAPWPLLHAHVPVFRSQHVPSRFLYPAVLMLATLSAARLGRFVDRRRRTAPWLDVAFALAMALLALDVARVAVLPMRQAMWMRPPAIPAGRAFHHELNPPFHYQKRDWAGPMLLSMMANTGVLDCYGVPRDGWTPAAVAAGDPRDRGMVWLDGAGSATLASWSPNAVRVRVEGARPGARLIYNMNHDRGWHASEALAGEVGAHGGLVSVALAGPEGALLSGDVVLRYRPPGWWPGCLLFVVTVATMAFLWRRRRMEAL